MGAVTPADKPAAPTPRVLFLDQSPALGGAELMLLDLVTGLAGDNRVVVFGEGPFPERLRARGINTEILALSDSARGVTKSAGVATSLMAGPAVWRAARATAALARMHDLIYANTPKALLVAAIAGRLARKPVIFHLHDLWTESHFSALNRRVACFATRFGVSHVVANSAASLEALRGAGCRTPATIVHNGINAAPFDTVTQEDTRRVRMELGLPGDATVVGVFGRLTPWKGQDVLLDALSRPELLPCRAIVVGDALYTQEDRQYAEMLSRRADAHPLTGRVQLLGHRDDVPALMKACDVIAHTSTRPEPFGRVIVEGMLAGTPVVATDAGGVREIVTQDRTGFLVAPGDASALAAAIERVRADRKAAQQVSRRARLSVRNRFSVETMVAGLAERICQIANRAPSTDFPPSARRS